MLRLYSDKKAKRIIGKCSALLYALEEEYHVPCACMQAILYQEITQIDLLDIAADWLVACFWLRYSLRKKLHLAGLPRGKKDSSTGYAQVFAATAIRSMLYAQERGIIQSAAFAFLQEWPLRPDRPDDLQAVWKKLHCDKAFNLRMAALTLLHAAGEVTGAPSFDHLTPEEFQLVFTRYNANVNHITPYGQAAYHSFLDFSQQRQSMQASLSQGE